MPPRALWSGAISFGLVSVPVRMTTAVREHDLHFHYIHEKDTSRIGYEKVCKKEGKPVPDDEIVKAFEFEKGEYVIMRDEDFEAAAAEAHRTIDIRDFVPLESIDPIFFEHSYYLEPAEGGEKVYALLVAALERSGLAGVAKFVMRERQHLACLRVRDGAIVLVRMHFADEVQDAKKLAPKAGHDKRELEMALQLIEHLTGKFEPEKYRDTYRDTLCEIIKARRKGKEVAIEAPEEPEQPTDLMAALRASLAAAEGRRPARGKKRVARDDLESLSKDELYDLAKKADIPGRSDMSKEELAAALSEAA
jgi:DNA end-binding protein Ku